MQEELLLPIIRLFRRQQLNYVGIIKHDSPLSLVLSESYGLTKDPIYGIPHLIVAMIGLNFNPKLSPQSSPAVNHPQMRLYPVREDGDYPPGPRL